MTAFRLRTTILAGFLNTGLSAVLQLVFIPVYLAFLGIESFGLLGLLAALQVAFLVCDGGMGPTISRELASLLASPGTAGKCRTLVRTFEGCYWALALGIFGGVVLASDFLANSWVRSRGLSPDSVRTGFVLMGGIAALQWLNTLYQNALLGMQRQVVVSGIGMGTTILTHGGAVLVLWQISPDILAFLGWRAVVALAQTVVSRWSAWSALPPPLFPVRFEIACLRENLRFTLTMWGITITGLLLSQVDKVILSRLLDLEHLGYYSVACSVAGSLAALASSLYQVMFPRFVALWATRDEGQLREQYWTFSEIMVITILPLGMTLAYFGDEIIHVWTGNPLVAAQAGPIVRVMVVGTTLNGLMMVPYSLQIALGRSDIALRLAFMLVFILIPTIILMTITYGGVGAAGAWTILNVVYMMVGVWVTHRVLLVGEARRWFASMAKPALAGMVVLLPLRFLVDARVGSGWRLVSMLGGFFLTTVGSLFVSSQVRTSLAGWWKERTVRSC